VVDEILGEGGSFKEAEGGAGVEFVIDDLIMFAICSPTVKAKTGSFGSFGDSQLWYEGLYNLSEVLLT
jgi:hypothetical protein